MIMGDDLAQTKEVLEELKKWSVKWGLFINPKKTQIMSKRSELENVEEVDGTPVVK